MESSSNSSKLAPGDVYDIIIKINAMKSLEGDGWEEDYSDKGLKRYKEKQNERSVVVSTVGNANKGKSFILGKIAGEEIPSGYSVTTEGLSIKYPTIKKKNIILLDTAGFETPLVENEIYKLEHEKKYYFDKPQKEEEYIKEVTELSRDRQMTEYFLQKFVISQANILICVVGQLTYSEQKFLNKIKKECGDKTLFIIHNLQNFSKKEQVDDYIKDILECSLTFKLKEFTMVSFEELNQNQNNHYFTEVFSDEKNEQDIVHLIMAKEKTEAGDFYNDSTINYIKNQIIAFVGIEEFPIEEKLKEFLYQISSEIMEEKIKKENIEFSNKLFKIKKEESNSLKLKKCLIDELGMNSFTETKFKPKYRYYKTKDGKTFVIQIIMCGKATGFRPGKPKIAESGEYYVFPIQGTKVIDDQETTKTEDTSESDKNKFFIHKRENGFFSFDIKVPASEITLASHKPKGKPVKKNGIITIEYELLQNNDEDDNDNENEKEKEKEKITTFSEIYDN